ncbi:MAG: acetate--CoA ligase family protein [Candidatus Hydrothermarchaeales archaeon]
MKRFLGEIEATDILREYGIPTSEGGLAKGETGALDMAQRLGYPVVLWFPDAYDRREIAASEDDLKVAYRVMAGDTVYDEASSKAVFVRKVPPGKEVTIGLLRDPGFGVAVTLSLGGIFSSILKESTYRLAPVSKEEALKMMEEIGANEVLSDRDMAEASNALVNISRLGMKKKEIIEMDIKLVVNETGAVAVDSKMIVTERR